MKIVKPYFISLLVFHMLFSCNQKDESHLKDYSGNPLEVKKMDRFLEKQMDSLRIPGISIAIINDGKIVYHRALGVANVRTRKTVDQNSIFEAASLSKPVFAYFVLKMAEKDIIDLDRPLHFYLSDESMERDQRYKQVTARMVLSHNTGFPNWRWFDELPEGNGINRGDFFLKQDPGTGFTYSGEAYQYLARVLAHVNFLNMNQINDLFQKEVSTPLGMEHAYYVWDEYVGDHKVFGHKDGKETNREWGAGLPHHNSLIFNAAGGLHTEAGSYARFLIGIMEEEGWYEESFEEMLKIHTKLSKNDQTYQEDRAVAWSLGFGIKPLSRDTLYWHGGDNKDFQSEFGFSLKNKFGYVFFCKFQ